MARRMSSQSVPKQSSPELSSLAARVLAGYVPTPEEVRSLAACVLSQDETPAEPKCETDGQRAVAFYCNIYNTDRQGAGLIGFRSKKDAMSIPDEYGVVARVKHLFEFTEGESF